MQDSTGTVELKALNSIKRNTRFNIGVIRCNYAGARFTSMPELN